VDHHQERCWSLRRWNSGKHKRAASHAERRLNCEQIVAASDVARLLEVALVMAPCVLQVTHAAPVTSSAIQSRAPLGHLDTFCSITSLRRCCIRDASLTCACACAALCDIVQLGIVKFRSQVCAGAVRRGSASWVQVQPFLLIRHEAMALTLLQSVSLSRRLGSRVQRRVRAPHSVSFVAKQAAAAHIRRRYEAPTAANCRRTFMHLTNYR